MVAKKKPTKVAKKATTKSTVTSKLASRHIVEPKDTVRVQSFRLSRETEKFISSRITRQTFYWLILSLAILAMGLLVLKTQLNIIQILNEISGGPY